MTMFAIHNETASDTRCSLRLAHDSDASFLFELFLERNAARFSPLGWSELQLRSVLQMQYRARMTGYQQFSGLQYRIICDKALQPIGEVVTQRTEQEIHIIDLCVSAAHRGRGVGTWIMQELQRETTTLTLRVDHGSPARQLYERLGFQETGRDDLQSEMCWKQAATRRFARNRTVDQL